MKPRVVWLATHAIQYQTPVFRELAQDQRLSFEVGFLTRHGMTPSVDPQFGRVVEWDTPLFEGFRWSLVGNAPQTMGDVRLIDVVSFLHRTKADLVIIPGYATPAFVAAVLAVRAFGGKAALLTDSTALSTTQRTHRKIAKALLVKRLWRGQHALVPGSLARKAVASLGFAPERIHHYPHCVDMDRFDLAYAQRDTLRNEIRTRLNWREDDFVFLFVGKFIELKRPIQIVEAFSKAALGPSARLGLIGSGVLEKPLAAACNGTDGAEVLGFVNQKELPAYYAAADALILFSSSETWGLVVNESMAMGRPAIVSSRVGCAPDLIGERDSGWVVEDQAALVRAMREAFTRRDLTTHRGANAKRVVESYRPSNAVDGVVRAAWESHE